MRKLFSAIIISSLLLSIVCFSSFTYAGTDTQGMNIDIRTSDDIIPDFNVDAITAILFGDEIEFRLYFTGGGIHKYNMFNPPSGEKIQIIKEFSKDDIDNGYMSFRYPFEEIKKFGELTIFVDSEYSVTKSFYIQREN